MSLDFLENDRQDDFDKYYFSNFAAGDVEPSTDIEPVKTEPETIRRR